MSDIVSFSPDSISRDPISLDPISTQLNTLIKEKSNYTIVIDAVFFQSYQTGIARVWTSLFKEWVNSGFAQQVVVLDRAGTAPQIPGITYRKIQPYNEKDPAKDSQYLEDLCQELKANLFISTYYTVPLNTPSALLAYDMIPEVMGWDQKVWPDLHRKQKAIRHASLYMAISNNTARDLAHFYPKIPLDSIVVAHCGVDQQFYPDSPAAIQSFKLRYGISKPYFLIVGGSGWHKNTFFFFQAFAQLASKQGFDIIQTGDAPFNPRFRDLVAGSVVHTVLLSDQELRAAYSGAIALVYPSKYEGFGMPILEAMACGCPVITCANSSIPEVAGKAVLYVEDGDVTGLAAALCNIQKPHIRSQLIHAGYQQFQKFSWSRMADQVSRYLASYLSPIGETPYTLHQLLNDSQSFKSGQITDQHLANLLSARSSIAEKLARSTLDQLEDFHQSLLGKAHRALWSCGINNLPIFIVEQLGHDSAAIDWNNVDPIISILIRMMYRYADIDFNLDLIPQIPHGLLSEILEYLFASPKGFNRVGNLGNYCDYTNKLVNTIYDGITRDPNSELWQKIAQIFTDKCQFTHLLFASGGLKPIFSKRAQIIEYSLKLSGSQLDHSWADPTGNRERIHVGILNLHFRSQSETFATLPIFEYLDKNHFHITLYVLELNNTAIENYCRERANQLVKLPENLADQVSQIRADDLDILVIGTNVTAATHGITLLAMHRLAHIQIIYGGSSPMTSGMRHNDYFLAGEWTEPLPLGQAEYCEQLVKLPGSGACIKYAQERASDLVLITRQTLGVSEDSIVFVSGANFYRIIPELRECWAQILKAVPGSVLLLYPFGPNWSRSYPRDLFKQTLRFTLSQHQVDPDRLLILDIQGRANVKSCLEISDIYLDSFPCTGGVSLLDALDVGIPPVVMDGDAYRKAIAASSLRGIGMTELIVNSEAAYRELACQLAQDQDRRLGLRQQIRTRMQGLPCFYDSQSFGRQIGDLFQHLFQDYQAQILAERFNLSEKNMVLFIDWRQPADIIYDQLQELLKLLANSPDRDCLTLLIDISSVSSSSHLHLGSILDNVVMSILLEREDPNDLELGFHIALVEKLSAIQWQAIRPRLQFRLPIRREDRFALQDAGLSDLPIWQPDR